MLSRSDPTVEAGARHHRTQSPIQGLELNHCRYLKEAQQFDTASGKQRKAGEKADDEQLSLRKLFEQTFLDVQNKKQTF